MTHVPFMMVVSGCASLIAAVAVVLLLLRVRAGDAAIAAAVRMRERAEDAEQATTRRLRLAAHDLRGIGMGLHGHADHLTAAGHSQAAGIATAAADLLDMADDLQDVTVGAGDPRVLREEPVGLGAALHEAIATVTNAIVPGRRNWRVSSDLDEIMLRFDPRALRHVLSRVLADAIRHTRQDDWIDVALDRRRPGLVVTIADEGAGSATPERSAAGGDSRGIGMRLTLARALMMAHGGRVEVEARARVGTRVSIVFPETRVRRIPAQTAPPQRFAA